MMPLTNYFLQGQKFCQTGCIGLEVEHFILNKTTREPLPWQGLFSVSSLMVQLSKHFDIKYYEQENLIGLENHWVLITLEPGCQLEISLTCMQNLEKIRTIYTDTVVLIQYYLDTMGYELVYSGGLPSVKSTDVKRIPKKRYEYMENWFHHTGTRGLEMMKATAAVHVSIDYRDEQDFIKKYKMANILHPIFSFITSNTLYYEGQKNKDVLLRDSIWHHTDPERCGVVPFLFEKDFGFDKMSKWLENLPLILMHDKNQFISTRNKTMKEVAKQYGYSQKSMEHYLSMVFLDVRLKRYIEIRSADSMPIEYTQSYCALIKGLFYQPDVVDLYSSITSSIESIECAKKNLRKNNWKASVYNYNLVDFVQCLFQKAKQGLPKEEQSMLRPLETLIYKKSHISQEIVC